MWDEQIDDVARRMTEGRPTPNLRARVLDGIETLSGRRSWRPLVALPTAAAAFVTALFVVFALNTRDNDKPTAANASAPAEAATPIGSPDATASAVETRPAVSTPTVATVRIARNPESVERAREVADPGAELLPSPDSIQVEPIDLATLPAVDSIAAEPLEIAALGIEPLDQQTDRQR